MAIEISKATKYNLRQWLYTQKEVHYISEIICCQNNMDHYQKSTGKNYLEEN